MDTHQNAPLTPKGREAMVRSVIERGLTKAAAALQFNVTAKTVAKWVKRFRVGGVDGLRDRSSWQRLGVRERAEMFRLGDRDGKGCGKQRLYGGLLLR
jgi:transposase-like protein